MIKKIFQALPLGLRPTGIIGAHTEGLTATEHKNFRHAAPFTSMGYSAEDLISCPAGIGLTIGHAWKVGRQRCAQPAAKDSDHDISLCGLWNLRLKVSCAAVKCRLPTHFNEFDAGACEPIVQALKPAFNPLAL